ncbi:hypothetical protein [Christiangramia sp. SM2212]|uniref:Uncharacterized protein n=1 Tax=Christiangramia sediminicola TaxID=3073267 RepID=A0ABU1EUC0_9FLAO|nr:hypothetical protein [Christiangramia sp. SM2212]MDR5591981.1 hypothetical protein [Christiangramia sp. SM2212]
MKQISLLLIVALISLGSFAQGNKKDKMEKHSKTHNMSKEHIDSEAHAMMYADKMTTRLNLSLEQKEEIREAQMKRLERQKEMMAAMMSEGGNMGSYNEEKKQEKMKIQSDFQDEMREILSPEQYQDWEPMHKREMKMQRDKMKNKDLYKAKGKNKEKNKGKDKDEYEKDSDDY